MTENDAINLALKLLDRGFAVVRESTAAGRESERSEGTFEDWCHQAVELNRTACHEAMTTFYEHALHWEGWLVLSALDGVERAVTEGRDDVHAMLERGDESGQRQMLAVINGICANLALWLGVAQSTIDLMNQVVEANEEE